MVTTVRSAEKASEVSSTHSDAVESGKLTIAIVPDISVEGCFDSVVAEHGKDLKYVLHTASPFHFRITDPKRDLVDPAVIGTTSLLKAVPPSVKRVVVTSSFASILSERQLANPKGVVFSEADWNDVTLEEISRSPATAYRASKTFAEKAAWDYVASLPEDKRFELATICPPMVFGPVAPWLADLGHVNTSNARIADLLAGKWRAAGAIPDTGVFIWIDVRDVAAAHIAAMEKEGAGGKRFFTTAGYYSNAEMVDIVRRHFPDLKDVLPEEGTKGGEFPGAENIYGYDNSRATKELGIDWIPFEKCVVDTVESLRKVGA